MSMGKDFNGNIMNPLPSLVGGRILQGRSPDLGSSFLTVFPDLPSD
jgi:hypothetical protein